MIGGGDGSGEAPALGSKDSAFQVIVLGSGGGPLEDNVTGFLVRSTAHHWAKDSLLAVDAGTHLASIARILDEQIPTPKPASLARGVRNFSPSKRKSSDRGRNGTTSSAISPLSRTRTSNGIRDGDSMEPPPKPPSEKRTITLSKGPFAGLELPHETSKANAAFINREFVSTYLITHPHIDHISGFVVNTASFQHTARPRRLAALPQTIDAFKQHVFNDVIWPNLTDEDGGVGLVTFMRLVEGGNVALGEGEGEGYLEVCDGLGVKGWSISHGHCMKRHSHRGSHDAGLPPDMPLSANGRMEGRSNSRTRSDVSMTDVFPSPGPQPCVVESTAYFIRDHASGKEILIFGDVEPDSISLSPRTERIWTEAAPKVASGLLTGIFIECSYDDSQRDEILFGHLAPRHLFAELKVLADKVREGGRGRRDEDAVKLKKRKRLSYGLKSTPDPDVRSRRSRNPHHPASRTRNDTDTTAPVDGPLAEKSSEEQSLENGGGGGGGGEEEGPLRGLKVIIMHMKDTLRDGASIGENILAQLQEYERETRLGCEFLISESGASYFL
ncbi:MAG: hypothetical protein M1836_001693 [Candelina mexicana]|nr:MAG: hypothetical protein M1836_001693 [Candelina mexicana]